MCCLIHAGCRPGAGYHLKAPRKRQQQSSSNAGALGPFSALAQFTTVNCALTIAGPYCVLVVRVHSGPSNGVIAFDDHAPTPNPSDKLSEPIHLSVEIEEGVMVPRQFQFTLA